MRAGVSQAIAPGRELWSRGFLRFVEETNFRGAFSDCCVFPIVPWLNRDREWG